MTALLLRARPADRPDLHPTGVELFDQALNGAALARGIPPFERDDAAPPLDSVDLLELEHRELRLAQLLQITRLIREPSLEIELGKLNPGLTLTADGHMTHSYLTTCRCTHFYRYRKRKCLPSVFMMCS
jgi:hypothetical protein